VHVTWNSPKEKWGRTTPFIERKAALGKLLFRSRDGIQYVEHAEGHGDKMFAAVCDLGLEGIVSKKLDAPYNRAIKGVVENQKSESTRCHSRH
jgi:ATP-dependent DNA ligase